MQIKWVCIMASTISLIHKQGALCAGEVAGGIKFREGLML